MLHIRTAGMALVVLFAFHACPTLAGAELCGDATRVFDVADAATAGVGLATPELQRDASDVVALLDEQPRRHR